MLDAVAFMDVYPTAGLNNCLHLVGELLIFSTLDAHSGDWQIKTDHNKNEKVIFPCHYLFYINALLQLPTKAVLSLSQQKMVTLLSTVRWGLVFVNLNNIGIQSRSLEEHPGQCADRSGFVYMSWRV